MRNLGRRRLLQLVVLVPLLAMVAFGGVLVLQTLQAYRGIERLSALEQLVSAASRLTTEALDEESPASVAFAASGSESDRAGMLAARRHSDDAIRAFKASAASAGLSDAKALGVISEIERRLGGLAAFRQKADARTVERRDAGELLQPVTTRLAELFQRIAHLTNQDQLSELLLALHASMQMNDGQKIESARSDVGLKQGRLDAGVYQLWLTGVAKQSIFGRQYDDLGPERVRDQLRAFEAGPDGRAIESLRPKILAAANGDKVSEADASRWRDAMAERNKLWSASVGATRDELTATTKALQERARLSLILYVAAIVMAVMGVMALIHVVLRVVRGLLAELTKA